MLYGLFIILRVEPLLSVLVYGKNQRSKRYRRKLSGRYCDGLVLWMLSNDERIERGKRKLRELLFLSIHSIFYLIISSF